MLTLFSQSILSQEILRAFCWTLLHSCWQGLVLAMLTGLLILLTRRSRPALRYNLLAGTFVLFFLTVGLTFVWQLRSAVTSGESTASVATVSPSVTESRFTEPPSMNNVPRAEVRGQWLDRLVNYCNEHASLIVAIWFVVFMVRLIKIMTNLGTIQRLQHYKTRPVSPFWKERIVALADRLQIRRPVLLLESALIAVPMMAGVFKPVILVPMGLLAQLPPEQVEAILLHELAHIRRQDYFVNLLQSFAEILFFFNPAVLWLSSLIREERENCCDDMAIEQTSSKKEFIHALVSFEEYSQPGLSCALAFPGSGNHLLKRVKRIVHRDDKRLSGQEKWFLLICLLMAGGLTMAFSRAAYRSETANGRVVMLQQADTTSPMLQLAMERPVPSMMVRAVPVTESVSPVMTITYDVQPTMVRMADMATEDTRIYTMPGDTTPVVKSPGARPYSTIIDTGGTEAREKALKVYREQQQELMVAQKKLAEQQSQLLEQQKVLTDRQQELMQRYKIMALEDGAGQDEELHQKLNFEKKVMLENKLNLENKVNLQQKLNMENKLNLQQKRDVEKTFDKKGNLEEIDGLNKTYNRDDPRGIEEKLKLERILQLNEKSVDLQREKLMLLQAEQGQAGNRTGGVMHPVVGPVIEELLERKLITNTEKLSFSLDKDGLIVNSVRQSAEQFKFFQEKFLHHSGDGMKYFRTPDGEERIAVSQTK